MSNNTQFGPELQLRGQESAVDVKTKLNAAKQAVLELVEAFDRGKTSLPEFSDAFKEVSGTIRELERANRVLVSAERERQASEAAAQAAAEQSVEKQREAAATMKPLADGKAQEAVQAELADQAEREAIAIQAEIEALAHEESQIQKVINSSEQSTGSIAREPAALEADQRGSLKMPVALNRESAEEAQPKEATDRETQGMWAEVTAMGAAEREALQFADALDADAAAATVFAERVKVADDVTGNFTTLARAAASSTMNLKGVMGSLEQSINAGGHAFLDFTSTTGALGQKLNSVSNNLPLLLVGLRGLGTVISVAATSGNALYRNWDSLASFWDDRDPFHKAAEDVESVKRELDGAKDSLEKMGRAGPGYAAQLAEYNELREDTARREKEIADQQERQRLLKKLLTAPSQEDEGLAEGFAEATKGQGQETLDTPNKAYRKEIENPIEGEHEATANKIFAFRQSSKIDRERTLHAEEEDRMLEMAIKVLRDPTNDSSKLATDLFARLGKGEGNAFQAIDRPMAATGVCFGDLANQIERSKPVLKMELQEEFEAAQKELKGEIKAGNRAFAVEVSAENKSQSVRSGRERTRPWPRRKQARNRMWPTR